MPVIVVVTLLCRYIAPPSLKEVERVSPFWTVRFERSKVLAAEGNTSKMRSMPLPSMIRVATPLPLIGQALLDIQVAAAAVVLVGCAGQREGAVDREGDRVGAGVGVGGTDRLAQAGLAIWARE